MISRLTRKLSLVQKIGTPQPSAKKYPQNSSNLTQLNSRTFSTKSVDEITFEYNENSVIDPKSNLSKIPNKAIQNLVNMFQTNAAIHEKLTKEFVKLSETKSKSANMLKEKGILVEINLKNEGLLADIQRISNDQETEIKEIKERLSREAAKSKQFAVTKMAQESLEIIDNFERLLQNLQRMNLPEAEKSYFLGLIKQTHDNHEKSLLSFGVKRMDVAPGQIVDPNFHHIISFIPVPGKVDDEILDITQVGYLIESRVLRTAKVVVVKNS